MLLLVQYWIIGSVKDMQALFGTLFIFTDDNKTKLDRIANHSMFSSTHKWFENDRPRLTTV